MTSFDRAVGFTLPEETGGDLAGGYNDRPTDRGGPTKYGISQHAHPRLDIRNLTRERALEIYREEYWTPAQCDQLPEAVAIAHFDFAFTSGEDTASEHLQRMVGAFPDGDIGPKTLAALQSFMGGRGAATAAVQLIIARGRYCANLVDEPEKPRERQNLRNIEGWVVRLIRLTAYVTQIN